MDQRKGLNHFKTWELEDLMDKYRIVCVQTYMYVCVCIWLSRVERSAQYFESDIFIYVCAYRHICMCVYLFFIIVKSEQYSESEDM